MPVRKCDLRKVVNHVAHLDGFDLNLSYRLLSVCANYRDKFSPHYACALERWNRNLGQRVLSQPSNSINGSTQHNMDAGKMMQKANMMSAPQQDLMWQSGPSGAVSVLTTVYSGVPPAYNAGGHQSYAVSAPSMYSNMGPDSMGYNGQVPVQKAPVYGVDGSYGTYQPQFHGPSVEYAGGAPQAAAMNAVQVAAAAVATATATAVALDQSQFQQYSQNPQYGAQQYPGSMSMAQGQFTGNPRMMAGGRMAMPPNYGTPITRTRQPVPNGARFAQSAGKMGAAVGHPSQVGVPMGAYNHPSSSVPRASGQLVYSSQMMTPGPGSNGSANGAYQARLPPNVSFRNSQYSVVSQNPAAYSVGYGQGTNHSMPPASHMMQGYNQSRMYSAASSSMSNASGICPGNPTPPMTPVNAGVVSPPGYGTVMGPASNMMPVDLKPAVNCQMPDDDIITLPVAEGIIMTPFRLEHNSPVTQHVFFLNEQTFNFLLSAADNDLQLKCFHQDDKMMACHWPPNANVQVCVNDTPVTLRNNDKPLYIKCLCQPNKNVLQIAVQQCSCSHLFILSLVQRPNIETVKENLIRRKMLPQDQAREKMKRLFHMGEMAPLQRSIDGQVSDIEQMSVIVSLRCPISMQKIRYPARGQQCRHPQCFDVETFLRINKDRNKWFCPLCRIELHLETLEIDQYVWGIASNYKDSPVDEISIDAALMWQPTCKPLPDEGGGMGIKIKDENSGNCSNAKRFKSETGASSGTWPGPPTPSAVASSVMSPSYCRTSSPMHPGNLQRQRSGNNSVNSMAPQHLTSQHTPQRQSMGPPTPQQVGGGGGGGGGGAGAKMGPLTPVTPLVNYNNPPSVGQPRSVGNGNPPSVEALPNLSSVTTQSQNSQFGTGTQIDGSFASSSAPYTPASVGSNGSTNHGAGVNGSALPVDNYGHELYGDLEFFLTDSTTNDSSGLFADSMDPMELLKYLDNGENNSSSTGPPTLAQQSRNLAAPIGSSPADIISGNGPGQGAGLANSGGSLLTRPSSKNNPPNLSSMPPNNNINNNTSTNLHDLDDVLSFLN